MRLATGSPRSSAITCKEREPEKPGDSIRENMWSPWKTQLLSVVLSKSALVAKLPIPLIVTDTLSTRHSPTSNRKICKELLRLPVPSPLSRVPLALIVVQPLLAVSSLSAQLEGSRLSLWG